MLLKAPWVAVTRDAERAKAADNQLQGTIQRIERGEAQCEVLMMTLPDGQCCARRLP